MLYCVLKIATLLASKTPYLVCSSSISMKYHTLHCLNVTYCHTYYDVGTLPLVSSAASLLCQS